MNTHFYRYFIELKQLDRHDFISPKIDEILPIPLSSFTLKKNR